MANDSASNLVDYLTLVAAILAPAIAAWATISTARRVEKERFSLHIDWRFFPSGREAELPFLYVQNKSSTPIIISAIYWYRGAIRRRQAQGTALWWEDPADLHFPYTIKSGEVSEFVLSEFGAKEQFKRVERSASLFGFFGRSSLWVGVTTISGSQKYIGAERVIPWEERPQWTKVEDK